MMPTKGNEDGWTGVFATKLCEAVTLGCIHQWITSARREDSFDIVQLGTYV